MAPLPKPEPLADRAQRAALVAAAHADAVDREGRLPLEAIAALKAERLFGAMIAADLGGEGLSTAEIADICALLGQHCSATAMVYAMHQIQVSSLMAHGRESAWHRAFMIRVAREELVLASATSEGGIGGDLRNSICAVETNGPLFHLVKEASVISYAGAADAILATARRNADAPSSDQIFCVVLKSQCTLEKRSTWNTLGMRGTCSDGYLMTVEAPIEQIFPKPFAEIAAQSMLVMSHLVWASLWYGIASDAFARAQSFLRAQARKAPPGKGPAAGPGALRLAEAMSTLQLMKSQIVASLDAYEQARATRDGLSAISFAVAMNNLKIGASESAVEVVQQALAICGINGYRNDTPYSVGRHLRDALSAPLMISNDRILANTSSLLLVSRHNTSLLD